MIVQTYCDMERDSCDKREAGRIEMQIPGAGGRRLKRMGYLASAERRRLSGRTGNRGFFARLWFEWREAGLQTMGLMAVVVKSGIFADDDNAGWRNLFLKKHSILGMISLPGDLFYPTAVDTTIMIAQAHRPQRKTDKVFMAKIWNDGYRKLKGKRVETDGSQLSEVLAEFRKFRDGKTIKSSLAEVVIAERIMEEGAEFSPEQYLPQPVFPEQDQEKYGENITGSTCRTGDFFTEEWLF